MTDDMIERVARAIAGEDWDDIPDNKSHWVKKRGWFGGRYRDVNERCKDDYLAEARAAIEAMPIRELVDLVQTLIDNDPSEPISDAGHTVLDGWRARAKVVLARHDRR